MRASSLLLLEDATTSLSNDAMTGEGTAFYHCHLTACQRGNRRQNLEFFRDHKIMPSFEYLLTRHACFVSFFQYRPGDSTILLPEKLTSNLFPSLFCYQLSPLPVCIFVFATFPSSNGCLHYIILESALPCQDGFSNLESFLGSTKHVPTLQTCP